MEKITVIDKSTCTDLQKEMQSHMDALAWQLGVFFEVGKMRYDVDSINIKVKMTLPDAKSEHMKNLLAAVEYLPISEEHIGKKFLLRADFHEITGYRPRSRKYPYVVRRCRDGKEFCYGEQSILRAINAEFGLKLGEPEEVSFADSLEGGE